MGQCCSKTQYELARRVDNNAWNNWDKHFARQFYDIDQTLGKGAFSEVVAATQRDNGRRVALKVVFLDNPRLNETHAAVLRDEVAIIESLAGHPNIVTFDCVMEDPVRRQFVIAEEILLGGTLTEELGAAAANNDDRLLAHVFKQLLSALAHMHAAGVVHRDLKPENVMFRWQAAEWAEQGALPVIIDFGMSTRYERHGPPVVGLLGSPGFVAPEVIEGKPHTPALDMFALGVILYICIAGRRPMTPKQANTLTYSHYEASEYPNMETDELWQSANARVQSLVLQLLERDPSARITAQQALQHPWVTADMRTPRPLSALGDTAAVAAQRRLRLSAERRQANVEEMLRYMVTALREREQEGRQSKAESGMSAEAPLGVHSTQHPVLTSCSAPQTGSATSFFQWMQRHLDDPGPEPEASGLGSTSPFIPSAAAIGAVAVDSSADESIAASAETAQLTRPLLRDVRSRSDMTHDASTSRSAAATVAAAWRNGSQAAASGGGVGATPADFLVQSHLHRHLSLAQRSSGKLQAAAPVPPPTPADAEEARHSSSASASPSESTDSTTPAAGTPGEAIAATPKAEQRPSRAETMPVRRGSDLSSSDTARQCDTAAEHAQGATVSSSSSPLSSSAQPTSTAPPTSTAQPSSGQHTVRFADAPGGEGHPGESTPGSGAGPAHSRTSSGMHMDPFPLYTQAKGNRLYSVVLAATRHVARRHDGGGGAASPVSRGSPYSDVSSVVAPDKAVGLEEISAVAQVEWGLRRWRQLAKRASRTPSARGRTAGDELPEEMKRARELAERALRFRGVSG
eukprot:jgi/Ulvmu1/2480/UM137_0006.1